MTEHHIPTPAAPPAAGPFDPAGVAFTPVSRGLASVRLISAGLSLLPFLAAAVVVGVLVGGWAWTGLLPVLAVGAWLAWLLPRQVRAIGYAEADDDLLVRSGIMFRSLTVVPYGRMQFVDVSAGPLDRKFDVARVRLHTASASTDATIPGLSTGEAARLRDRLTARGEARLAGL